jgi:NitT/TauT family transport system permease protein
MSEAGTAQTQAPPALRARPSVAAVARSRRERIVVIGSPIVLLLLWEAAARTGLIDARIVPPPTVVIATIYDMLMQQGLANDIGATVARFVIGMVAGVIPGVFLGLTMGLFRWVGLVLGPIVGALYNVPRIALFPLVLILVGLNESSNILMIALGPFFTMLITSMGAVMNVDQIYRDVAKNFGARRRDLYFMVTLPAIAPALMGGLRISVGLGLLGVIAVEFLVAESGLGHVIWNSWQVLSLKQSMAGLVVAALVGYVFFSSLTLLERLVIPWQRPSTFA